MYLIDHVEPFCSLSVDAERERESEREANILVRDVDIKRRFCGCCRKESNNILQGSKI